MTVYLPWKKLGSRTTLGKSNPRQKGFRSCFRETSGKVRHAIAEEFLLVYAADDDKGSCSCVLVILGFALFPLLAPFSLDDLKRRFESVVDQGLDQAVIDAVVQFDLPNNGRGWVEWRSFMCCGVGFNHKRTSRQGQKWCLGARRELDGEC
jgi:hypothetical protein